MLRKLLSLFGVKPAVEAKPDCGAARSSRWPAVRKAYIAAHPNCEACGGKDNLEVHHIEPFHVNPAKELDSGNLVSLCDKPSRNCHFVFGHALNWKGWVPTVREDVAAYRKRVDASDSLAKRG